MPGLTLPPEALPMTHLYRHRVRYRECDPMGVVYHTHALDWFEAARTEALRERGLAYKALEDSGIIMPVVEATLRYHASVFYDDVIEVETTFAPPRVKVPIDYAVRREGETRVLISGRVTLCFIDTARQRPVTAPDAVLAAFAD